MVVGRSDAWSFKKDGSLKILAEFHESRSLGFLAVMCISQSRVTQICLAVLIFFKAKKNLFSYKVK